MLPISSTNQSQPENHTNSVISSQSSSENPPRFAIKSKNVILEEYYEPVEAIILIQGEKIMDVVVLNNENSLYLNEIYNSWDIKDYGNLLIFPGLVDTNVHLHATFGTEWDNVVYCTELAAAGGVTTIIDNPVMAKSYDSGDDYMKSLQQRIKMIKANSKVDFGIYGTLEPKTEKHIGQMLEAGVMGLKSYMTNCFQNTVGHYPPEGLLGVMRQIEQKYPELLLLVHPEVATERELYLSSPCRIVPLERRLDRGYTIKSLEFGGGANKGSYVEEFSKKGESEDENDDEENPEGGLSELVDSPSKLKKHIKKTQEKTEINDLVHFELSSYSFENQINDNTDESGSDSEMINLDKIEKINKCMSQGFSISPIPCGGDVEAEKNDEEESMVTQNTTKRNSSLSFKEIKLDESREIKSSTPKTSSDLLFKKSKFSFPGIEINKILECDHQEEQGEELSPQKADNEQTNQELKEETPDKVETEQSNLNSIDNVNQVQRKASNAYLFANDSTKKLEEVREDDEFQIPTRERRSTTFRRKRFLAIDDSDDNCPSNEKSPDSHSNQSHLASLRLAIMGSNSGQNGQKSTIDTTETFAKNSIKDFSQDFNDVDESREHENKQNINHNRKFLSLIASSETKDARPSIKLQNATENINNNESHLTSIFPSSSPILQHNPASWDCTPSNNGGKSLGTSPSSSKGDPSSPSGSSLLQRRLTRNSSSIIPGSTSSALSSPNSELRKINFLNFAHISKGTSEKETKYNQSYRIFLANRPQNWEENAVSLILGSIKPNTRIRIVLQNLSLASSLFKIREKKKASEIISAKIFSDTCPSFLFFTEKMVKKGETKYKSSPPFRNKENRQLLIENLRLGTIDVMSSYHLFVPPRFKMIDDGNFRRAFSGLDSMGCSLQAVWTTSYSHQQKNNKKFLEDPLYHKKSVNNILIQMYKTMCYNPAQMLKIGHRKGKIAKGMDADFVIWDPYKMDDTSKLSPNHVFAGRPLMGAVQKTYLRGNLIYSMGDNEQVNTEYVSNFIRP